MEVILCHYVEYIYGGGTVSGDCIRIPQLPKLPYDKPILQSQLPANACGYRYRSRKESEDGELLGAWSYISPAHYFGVKVSAEFVKALPWNYVSAAAKMEEFGLHLAAFCINNQFMPLLSGDDIVISPEAGPFLEHTLWEQLLPEIREHYLANRKISMPKIQCLSILTKDIMDIVQLSMGLSLDESILRMTPEVSDKFLTNLDAAQHLLWLTPRERVEQDSSFLQFLPYLLVGDVVAGDYLCYNRPAKNAEARLSGNFSMGFGGHMDLQDLENADGVSFHNPADAFKRCILRELEEELGITLKLGMYDAKDTEIGYTDLMVVLDKNGDPKDGLKLGATLLECVALIHDTSNPVGQVHLGLVYILDVRHLAAHLTDPSILPHNPDEIVNLRMLNLADAKQQDLPENWTKLILDKLLMDSETAE